MTSYALLRELWHLAVLADTGVQAGGGWSKTNSSFFIFSTSAYPLELNFYMALWHGIAVLACYRVHECFLSWRTISPGRISTPIRLLDDGQWPLTL